MIRPNRIANAVQRLAPPNIVNPLNTVGLIRESCETKEVVIAASPIPMIICQKSIAGIVTITPPADAKIGETPICTAHAKDPKTIENHDAKNTLVESHFRLEEEPKRSLTT